MRKANEWIALKITLAVSTMWAFYILVLYGLTPLIWPQYMNTIMYWSNFVQLIFLPLLAVGTAVMGRSSERRAQETHDAVMAELAEMKDMHKEVHSVVTNVHVQSTDNAQDIADKVSRSLMSKGLNK